MTLRQKLLLAQVPLAVAVLLLGVVAALTTRSLASRADDILRENYRSVLAMQRVKESLERLDSAELFLLVGQKEKALAQLTQHQPLIEQEISVAEGNITEAGELDISIELRAGWQQYQQRLSLFIKDPSPERYFSELDPLFLALKQRAETILNTNQDAMVRKSNLAQQAARQTDTIVLVTALLSLAGGLLASFTLTGRLLRPLATLSRVARRIGEGDYEVKAEPIGRDEIAQLSLDFNSMAERLREYKKSSLGKLLQAQRASQAAIESLPDPVVIFDLTGEILATNRTAERLLTPAPLGEDALLRGVLARVSSHVLSGQGAYVPKGFEESLRLHIGEVERFFLPRANPIYGEDGAVLGVTVLIQDVTRLRHFDELKNDLVATVAHEFRTPLTSLRMAIYLCAEQVAGPLTEKQTELLLAAREDTERLQGIVDELLDLARIQAGRFELMTRATRPETLLQSALETHRAAAEERQIELLVEVAPALSAVNADPERAAIALSNLLSNALRYTKDGGQITLSAREALGAVRFAVRDEGPGVPAELQAVIFEKFIQLPGGAGGAAGFGLFLAREIVKAHLGDIGVQSEAGQGAEFWFTLPASKEDPS